MKHSFDGKVVHNEQANLYHTHIIVPESIHDEYKAKNIKRIIFTLNGQEPNHGGFIPLGDGTYFILTSKQLLKRHKIEVGEAVKVVLWEDTSKYGMPICEEMKELLEQDPEGSKMFHALTDGKIRSLLYKVNGYKSSDKRLEKGIIVLEHLNANNGILDWKMLNEAFKQGIQ